MADITVSTFAEFRTAAAEAAGTYDNIICPDSAVWDMNVIDPENNISALTINANVTGNGTELQNFRGKITVKAGKTVSQFHVINMFSDVNDQYQGAFYSDSRTACGTMYQCKISLTTGSTSGIAFLNMILTRCSVNIAMQKSGGVKIFDRLDWNYGKNRYNRVKIEAPNMTGNASARWEFEDSEFIINAQNTTEINSGCVACTIRGNLSSCTTGTWKMNASICVLSSESAPNYVYTNERNIKLVTDSQMRDISYLQSIGFRIGSE